MKINYKIPALLLIIILPFLLTACGRGREIEEYPEQTQQQVQNTNDNEVAPLAETEDAGVIESIRDALVKNKVLKCRYITDGDEFYMYLKGQRAALESNKELDGKPISYKGVVKDDKYYVWQVGKSEGLSMDLTKKRENPLKVNDNPVYSFDDVIRELEVSKKECSTVVTSDTMFEVPSEISFTEW